MVIVLGGWRWQGENLVEVDHDDYHMIKIIRKGFVELYRYTWLISLFILLENKTNKIQNHPHPHLEKI